MFGNSVHSALVHAATQYDIRQSKGRSYNRYALAQYLMRIDEIEQDIAAGATVRDAIEAAFSGSLLKAMLKAVDLQPGNLDSGHIVYVPASAK